MADDDFIPEPASADDRAIESRFGELDDALVGEAGMDDRVSSGVPEGARADDDDFLAMSGIAPASALSPKREPVAEPEDDINFYESGVTDVDAGADSVADAAPEEIDLSAVEASLGTPVIDTKMEDLKSIMADLAGLDSEARAPEPTSTQQADISDLLEQVKSDIVAQIKGDISALRDASDAPENQLDLSSMLDEAKAEIINQIKGDISSLRANAESTSAAEPQIDISDLLGQIKSEILDGIHGDIDALKEEQRATAEAIRESTTRAQASSVTDDDKAIGAPSPGDAAPELAEAERLIQELQEQPRASEEAEDEPTAPEFTPIDLDAIAEEAQAPIDIGDDGEEFGNERDATVYDQPGSKKRRKGSRKERFRRRAKRYVLGLLVIGALVAVGWPYMLDGWRMLIPSLQSPNDVYSQAEALYANDQPIQASRQFQAFHRDFPNDPRAEESLYKAAYALLSAPPNLGTQHYRDAIGLFDRYASTYPESDRADTIPGMKGLAHHLMGEHEQAITILTSSPAMLNSDDAAAIPLLRTLAQAHAAREELAEAEIRLQQAASMRSNFTVDQDYSALADIAVLRARRTGDRSQQEELLESAEGYIDDALRCHYIDQQRQNTLEKKRDQIAQLREEGVEAEAPGIVTQSESIPIDDGPSIPIEEDGPVPMEDEPMPTEEIIPEPAPMEEVPMVEDPLEMMEEAPVLDGPVETDPAEAPEPMTVEAPAAPEVDTTTDEMHGTPVAPEPITEELPEMEEESAPEIPEVAPESEAKIEAKSIEVEAPAAEPKPKPAPPSAQAEGSMSLEAPEPE